jgi:hypothetical protein
MQLRGVITATLCLLALLPATAAAQATHPNLLLNRQEIAEMKAKIAKYAWARQVFERIKADAEADVANPYFNLPTRVAPAMMYALTGEEKYAKRAREHIEPQHLKELQERNCPWQWNRGVEEAILFDLVYDTFSERERREIENAFRKIGRVEIDLAESGYQTWNMKWVEHWNVAMMGYATGDRQLIDYGLNDPGGGLTSGKGYCRYDPKKYGGFHQIIERNVKEGTWHEPPEYLFNAISFPFFTLALAAKHFDGTDLYHWRAPNGNSLADLWPRLVDLTFPAEDTGMPGGTFRVANYGDGGTTAWRDLYLINSPWQIPAATKPAPRLADEIYTNQGMLEIAHHFDPRPVYAWFLRQPAGRDRMFCNSGGGFLGLSRPALAYGRPLDDAPAAPPPAPSSLLADAGLAMLRADESPAYWHGKGLACFFIMGEPQFRSHRHCDDYQIILHGQGRLLYPDLNTWNYENDKELGWTHRSIAHNTLVVDGASNVAAPYTARHDFSPEVKFVAARGAPFEKQDGIGASPVGAQAWPKKVVLSRALFLTKEYLADFFWAASPAEHVYDWALHGFGRLEFARQRFQASQDLAPYRWIKDVSKCATAEPWSVEWRQSSAGVVKGMPESRHTDDWFTTQVGVKMWMLAAPGTSAYVGEGPLLISDMQSGMSRRPQDPEGRLPMVVARRQAANTLYAALHEPVLFRDKGKPVAQARIRSFELVGQTADTIAVKIVGPDYVDYACVSFSTPVDGRPGATLTNAASGESLAFNNFAYLRYRANQIAGRGELLAFAIRDGGAGKSPSLTLNGQPAGVTAAEGQFRYKESR